MFHTFKNDSLPEQPKKHLTTIWAHYLTHFDFRDLPRLNIGQVQWITMGEIILK